MIPGIRFLVFYFGGGPDSSPGDAFIVFGKRGHAAVALSTLVEDDAGVHLEGSFDGQMVGYAVDKGIRPIIMLTNGTLLNEANVSRLLESARS